MQSSFFDLEYEKQAETAAPLASRMRPTTLDGFVGQGHIVGKGKLLSRLIAADKLTSAIFYGPPGRGRPPWRALSPIKPRRPFTS